MPVLPSNAQTFPAVSGTGGGGGGGAVDPVEPPDPQSATAAEDGSLAAFTFGAFDDDGGRINSYGTPTVTNVVGSGVIASGSGLGPYTLSGTANGEVITVNLPALDSGGNVIATATYTGTIAGSAPASELLATWDFRTADTGTLSGTGTITKNSGGTDIVGYRVFVQSGSATATTDITADGLRVNRSGASGVSGIALELSGVLGLCDNARDTLLFFVHFASITNATMIVNTNANITLGSADNTMSSTPTRGLMMRNTSASQLSIQAREYDGSVTTVTERVYGSSWPTSGTALLEMSGSRVFAGFSDASNPARSAVPVASAGISSGDTAPRSAPLSTSFTDLLICTNPQVGGDLQLTISHIRVLRLAVGAS